MAQRKEKPVEPLQWGPDGPHFVGTFKPERWFAVEDYFDSQLVPGIAVKRTIVGVREPKAV